MKPLYAVPRYLCRIIIPFIAITILFSLPVRGESLLELQDKAAANRKMIEKYRLEVRKGELDKKIVQGRFLPSADLTLTGNQLDESSLMEDKENSVFRAAITYNIFSGFKDRYDLKAAELLENSKDYELESMIQDIRYGVAVRYLEIFGKKSSLTVAEDEYNLLKKRYEDAENRYSVGLIKKNDLLKLKVQLDDAQQNLKKSEAEVTKTINRLEFEIDSDISSSDLSFNEFEEIPEIEDIGFYESRLLERRSEIKLLETLVAVKEFGAESAKSAYYPRADVSGSFKRYEDSYFPGDNEHDDELRLQVNISLNLFDGFKKGHSLEKAKIDTEIAKHDLYELKQELITELKNLLLDYEVALKNLKVAKGSISQAEENLRITDVSFKEGVETAADVLDAISYLSRAKYNFINARNELFRDYYGLIRMTGDF